VRLVYRALLMTAIMLVPLAPARAFAADVRSGNEVRITSNQAINDDLYLTGNTVDVEGPVNGDVVVFGGTVNLLGPVAGDVIAAGGTTVVAGPVRGSVRVAGGDVTVRSRVTHDVLVAAGTVTLQPQASVGRDALLGAGNATVTAPVARNLIARANELTLASHVGGNVQAEVGTLHLAPGATIDGNLDYTSGQQAQIDPGATVRGQIQHRQPEAPSQPSPVETIWLVLLGWLRALVGLFVFGLLFVLPFRHFSRQTIRTLATAPWESLGIGFGVLAGVPVAAFFIFILGLIVGGWWIAMMLVALYAIAVVLGYVVASIFTGYALLTRVGRSEISIVLALLSGLEILLLLGLVPVVGLVVGLAATTFGLGALALTAYRVNRTERGASAT